MWTNLFSPALSTSLQNEKLKPLNIFTKHLYQKFLTGSRISLWSQYSLQKNKAEKNF